MTFEQIKRTIYSSSKGAINRPGGTRQLEKKMKYNICDNTSNTGKNYIDENGQNCMQEQAAEFDTREEAVAVAQSLTTGQVESWEEWASITEAAVVVTQEMIDAPFENAILVNRGEGCAMRMQVIENYFVFFPIEMDQLPEDVDYSPENIIDEDDCRED